MTQIETNTDHPKNNSREGNLNPMYGKRHSYDTRQKMSQAQKQRYSMMRKVAEEERIRQIIESPNIHDLIKRVVNETLTTFLGNETRSVTTNID